MSISRHWLPGDSVVLRRVWRRKLCRVTAATVVQDTPELIALYWRKGCPLKVTREPFRPTKLLSAERLNLVDGVWGGTDVLLLVSPRAAHAVYAMWQSGHASFVGWYINLQEPVRRTPIGFDTMDHWLDIVISPDRSEWRWKDEDEFAEAVTAGVLSADQARAIRAEGERAIRLVQAGPSSFYDAWEAWLPPTEWKIPELPSGWDSIAPL